MKKMNESKLLERLEALELRLAELEDSQSNADYPFENENNIDNDPATELVNSIAAALEKYDEDTSE